MMEEILRYEKLNRSVGDLSEEIIQKLMRDGYQLQSNSLPGMSLGPGYLIASIISSVFLTLPILFRT